MDLSPLRKWEILGPDAEALMQRDGHAQHPPAGRRPGRLHGAVQRDRRDDRRRHGVPARRRQLPLRRRRRLRRRLAEGAGRADGPEGVRQAVDRSAAQPGGAGAVESRSAERPDLDAEDAARVLGSEVVPVLRRADRRLRRDPGRGLAHRLQRRARLRGVVPSVRRRRGVGRDLGGGAAVRDEAARARGARRRAHRGGADLRGLRVRRPGRPVRGRASASPWRWTTTRTSSAGRAGGAPRASAAPLVGLELEGNEVAGHGDFVYVGPPAGRRRDERLRCPIASRRAVPHGRAVRRDRDGGRGRQARRPAEAHPREVVRFPFYDPDKTRPRS